MESSYEPSEMKSMFLYCICAPLGVEEGSPLYEAIFAGDFPERRRVFDFHPHLKEIWIEKGFELFWNCLPLSINIYIENILKCIYV